LLQRAAFTLKNAIRATGVPRRVFAALPPPLRTRYGVWKLARMRAEAARPYLRGEGIEIGAMHFPLKVQRGVKVCYVDYVTREENLKKFPYLDARKLVTPDYIEDGFRLEGIPLESQDFVIANHVLEHSPDPIGTLEVWWKRLRAGGVLFITVPLAEHCFDRGRKITPLEHMIEDHEAAADLARLADRNLEHYREWVAISLPQWAAEEGMSSQKRSPEQAEGYAQELKAGGAEIHFHAFTADSFAGFAQHFCARSETPGECLAVLNLGAEVLAVLRRRSPSLVNGDRAHS
jgi:SAM-dependent methyltransferase